jgi:hypothetical protein
MAVFSIESIEFDSDHPTRIVRYCDGAVLTGSNFRKAK